MYTLEFEKAVKKDFKNINISDIKFIKDKNKPPSQQLIWRFLFY